MSNVFGKNFKTTIFGESHAAGIGAVIDGIPPGLKIDMVKVEEAMKRRAPNTSAASTKRNEADKVEILCGLLDGAATGAPLCGIIYNKDTKSADYEKTRHLLRPGHADYTGYIKYKGANDLRGGGHFSGRITAPLVFAGSIARQYLEQQDIYIGAHIKKIGKVMDDELPEYTKEVFDQIEQRSVRVVNKQAGRDMLVEVEEARRQLNSLGGVIQCAMIGLPVGLGEPFFDSMESTLAHMMFSIPAIKGIEFGSGFQMTDMMGSEANDPWVLKEGTIQALTNHNGGINGGITNGMPLLFKTAIRPTASISKKQQTVDITTMEESEIQIVGRHDACIVPRAVEVVKCAAALVVADLLLEYKKYQDGER